MEINTITQTTTNNETNVAPVNTAGVEQTTILQNKENTMTNSTITEANTITTQDTQMTNTQEQTITMTEETQTMTTPNTNTSAIKPALRTSKIALSNEWAKVVATPDLEEIEEIKEARRSVLVKNHMEPVVASIIDTQIVPSTLILTQHDGQSMTLRDIIIANLRTKVQDIIEPKFGNDTAIVKHTYIFDAVYKTNLRGGETYKIDFTFADIISILSEGHMQSSGRKVIQALVEFLSTSSIDEEGIKDIAATLILSHYVEVTKKNLKYILSDFTKSILNKRHELNPVIDAVIVDSENKAFEIMKDYAFLYNQGKPQIINTTKLGLVASSEGGLKSLHKNQLINGVNPVDIWMHSPRRPLFIDTKFDPSFKSQDDRYNLFKGYKYEAKKGTDISMFVDFVKEIICSGDELMFNIVWTFLAQMLQDPTRKMGTALVLLSNKGTGKSSYVYVLGKLMEGYFMQTAEQKRLMGEFNSHLSNTLLFNANELTFTDNKRVISKLKNVITETEFTYELKGGATFTGENFTRVVIDSNDDQAVVQTADERRFIYPKISEEKIGDTYYFNKLYASFEVEGFYESLMHELMNFDYAPWEHYLKTPPKNEVTEEQMLESFMEVESFWLNCLEEGRIPYVNYEVTYDGKLNITNEAFYQSFVKYTRANGGRVKLDSAMFGKAFKKHVLQNSDLDIKSKMTVDGIRKNSRIYDVREKSVNHFVSIKRLNRLDYDGGEWIEPAI